MEVLKFVINFQSKVISSKEPGGGAYEIPRLVGNLVDIIKILLK